MDLWRFSAYVLGFGYCVFVLGCIVAVWLAAGVTTGGALAATGGILIVAAWLAMFVDVLRDC